MKIQFTCLLLVLLSATVLSQDPTFHDKHVIPATDNQRDCTALMKNRNLFTAKNGKVCTAGNTFIVETDQLTANKVCAGGGEEKESGDVFEILDCTFNDKKSKLPNCVYTTKPSKGRIILKCQNGQPVIFKGAKRI